MGYEADHHWRCREIIKEWLDSGDLQDAFRHLNPETLSYTWKDDMLGKKQGRIDYMLLSPGLMNMVTSCHHKHHPWSLTDHSSVNATFRLERTSEGPGVFRAMPGIQNRGDYDAEIRHLLTETLVENSGLSNEEKFEN